MFIGCHMSNSNGYCEMGKQALSINANTLQFFTRNPRGGKARDIDPKDMSGFMELMKNNGFAKVIAHAPYTLNPCAAENRTREFAFEIFADDLARMEYLPGNYYNFHPGSHVGQGIEKGIELITDLLDTVLNEQQSTTVLLETMSGKGSEVGSTFTELRQIMDKTKLGARLGVCLDLCHVYSAGYDIVNHLDDVLLRFDDEIGLDRLLAIHLNDSMNEFGSAKDRHAKIGEGSIGLEAIARIINHKHLRHLPFCLETPNELDGHAKEIALLRSLYID